MLVINLLGVEVRAGKYRNNVRGSELMLTVLSSFPQVIMVQSKYSTNGVDGYFRDDTKAAVTAFQNAYGLDADGIAGSKTLGKINELGT